MLKLEKKHTALLAVLIIISAVCFLFAGRKDGMFIDEIYTYGLSNSYYAPFVTDIKGGDMRDTVMTRQELVDYLFVGEDDRFAYGSVYYNQVNDVHPPLHYWLLHTASSLAPEQHNMWPALVLDYIIYMGALIALYALAVKLFGSRPAALAAVCLYGLSVIGLSTMLMIRMYVLLTFFTVLLAYAAVSVMKHGRKRDYVLLWLSIFLGLLTQYYFVFYAFFLCAAVVVFMLCRREFKKALVFALWAFAGVGVFVLAFPACFEHLFADALVSGGNAVENIKNVAQYSERLEFFNEECSERMRAIRYVSMALAALCLVRIKKLIADFKAKNLRLDTLIVLLPAFVTYVLVAIISPVAEIRYVYSLIPVFVLGDALMLYWLLGTDSEGWAQLLKYVPVMLIGAVALWYARTLPPDYLYEEHEELNIMLSEYADTPCIYMDDNYPAPITFDMLQLMVFEDFLITADTDSPAIADYLDGRGRMVVFIDLSEFWSSGFDAEEVLDGLSRSTGFENITPLYSNGFSDVYLMEDI